MRQDYIEIDQNDNDKRRRYAFPLLIFTIIATTTFVLLITYQSTMKFEDLSAHKDETTLYMQESTATLRTAANPSSIKSNSKDIQTKKIYTDTSYSCVDDFAANIPTVLQSTYFANPVLNNAYSNVTLITSDGSEYMLPVWCLNYYADVQAESVYNESSIYPWTEVIANDNIAGQILDHARLNQVAWLLNNVEVGELAIGPVFQDSVAIEGCDKISVSDIQLAIWALVNVGKCDDFTKFECVQSLINPNQCNAAYIYYKALNFVHDGATYNTPSTCSGNSIFPVIILPDSHSQPLIVSSTIAQWGFQCNCPTPVQFPTKAPQITAAPTTYSCAEAFSYSIPSVFYSITLDNPIHTNFYSDITLVTESGAVYDFPVWCINYFKDIYAQVTYNETLAYSWLQVLANPALVPVIENPLGLSQIAWLLNNVFVGDIAIGPVTWNGVKLPGCTYISSSDLQAAIWAIMNKVKCSNPEDLDCTESLRAVNLCNVGYIVNGAYKAVPEGVIYTIPNNCDGDIIVPIVVVASEILQPLVVSATISQWDYKCDCPYPVSSPTRAPQIQSCTETFTDSLPQIFVSIVLTNPVLPNAYSNLTLYTADGQVFNFPVYCLNYFAAIQAEYIYNDTSVYGWTQVVGNPSLAGNILTSTSLLNQVSWILNNIRPGDEATGPQYYDGQINGCSYITASDIQRAIWVILDNEKCSSLSPDYCKESLLTINICNVAYIYNSAFAAVPKGSTYVVPNTCDGDVIVPVVVVPNGYTQPFAIAASISDWGYECPCASSGSSISKKSIRGWLEGGPTESPTTILSTVKSSKGIKKVSEWLEGGPTESPTVVPIDKNKEIKKVNKWLEGGPTESPTVVPIEVSGKNREIKKVSKWLEGGPTESPTTIPYSKSKSIKVNNLKKANTWLEGGPTESPTSVPL